MPSPPPPPPPAIAGDSSILSRYLGLSFALFLGSLPRQFPSYLASLQSRNRILALKLFEAEDELRQLRSRRKEDAKANARVAEIFSGHRSRWQQEHRRLLARAATADEEIAALRARAERAEAAAERLEREVAEREEMLEMVATRAAATGIGAEVGGGGGAAARVRVFDGAELGEGELGEIGAGFGEGRGGFVGEAMSMMSAESAAEAKGWPERVNGWEVCILLQF